MKKTILFLSFIMLCLVSQAQVSQIVGRWQTIDDEDGSKKSIVHIFKSTNGKYYGKIEHLYKNPDKKCTECQGNDKDKPVMGMIIIRDMKESKSELTGGTIMDPKNGKVYKCNINFDKKSGNLIVRGSLDAMGILGRSQTWIKTN